MTQIDAIASEFEHEAHTTRRHLERLPDDRLDWRPHQKSYTARELASHIVECVGWTGSIFGSDELDFTPATYQPFLASSVPELLKSFDEQVAEGTRVLAAARDEDLVRPWRLKVKGRVQVEKPKAAMFRDFTLSHVIHHRGQLSVYLRLLDVPVPGSYGPTADESG
jgi:uncharacterized damage-inducible protein DinB